MFGLAIAASGMTLDLGVGSTDVVRAQVFGIDDVSFAPFAVCQFGDCASYKQIWRRDCPAAVVGKSSDVKFDPAFCGFSAQKLELCVSSLSCPS